MTRCITGKVIHRNIGIAAVADRGHHRDLNRQGIVAVTSYAYPCQKCRGWHLTRMASFRGKPRRMVAEAAPVELQQWAFPPA